MRKIVLAILALTILFIGTVVALYICVIPNLVQNNKVINFVEKEAAKNFNIVLDIKKPRLVTHFYPDIEFSAENILIKKDGAKLLNIENLEGAISFSDIFSKKIILKKLVSDNIFADADKLMKLAAQQPQEPVQSDWIAEWQNAELSLKNLNLVYSPIKISGKDIKFADNHLHFNALVNGGGLGLKFNDDNKVYFKDNKFCLDNLGLNINKSRIFINSVVDEKGNFDLSLNSKQFYAQDAIKLILLIPEAREPLSYFGNVGGNFNFDINVKNDDIKGKINFKTLKLSLIPFANLPVIAQSGLITIDNKQILLKNFKGYYGTNEENKASLEGSVRDYLKSANTEIIIKGMATNELTKNYISKLAGLRIELVGNMPTKLTVKSENNTVDMNWTLRVKKEKDVLLEGLSFSPIKYDRMLKADFHLEKDLFTIKSIDYYIAQTIKRGMEIKPIISIAGNLDARDFSIKDMGFEITKPLPSEFLNLFTQAKTFKNGTIAGHLKYINAGGAPFLDGNLEMNDVRIPSQRLSVKKGVFNTDKNSILLNANGRFRRSDYNFDGNIVNKIALPIVVKDVNLKIENINIERILKSLNQQAQGEQIASSPSVGVDKEDEDGAIVFVPNVFVIEKCNFRVNKGTYKKIEFGNLDANLTLDKEGNLKIQSNRFDFAKGISTLKVNCELAKNKYYIRLGAKDIDIDIVASSILDLEKEITGKASALLELDTDDKFKLNGLIRFTVKDGGITKLGLIQYILNAAALFRNPTLISPSTLFDLVNVPEGTFKSIDGELNIKNNIVRRMKIKSISPQLSSFIAGRMNLETGDTSLRIYTKFSNKNKGLTGFLRKISLNSLSHKFDTGENNNANYYSAEIAQLPEIEAKEEDCQIFLTKVEGDVGTNNFISSLKKIK